MISWKKKNLSTGLLFFSCLLPTLLSAECLAETKKMISEKYLVSFKTKKSTCILRVNDLHGADSTLADLRTISMGYNSTAFLENGQNKVEVLMGPMDHTDPETLFRDSECTVSISKDNPDQSIEVANFIMNVNDNNKISAADSVNHTYSNQGKSFYEGYSNNSNDFGLYKLESNIFIKGLPKWSWVDATPVTENDLPKIRAAYEKIWKLMYDRDIEGLINISRISIEELAYAEGASQKLIFMSTDLPQNVANNNLRAMPIDWKKYRLKTYRGGRLFRMTVGFFENSPLKMMNADGKAVYAYAPYFSMIDGRVVLVR